MDAEPIAPDGGAEAAPRGGGYRSLREIAEDERPRERLLHHGPEVLSDSELVAIILGSGLPGENVLDLARSVLEGLGGLAGLVRADTKQLQRARGLGPAKAAQLAAAVEVGRRMQQLGPEARPMLSTPEAVYALIGPRLIGATTEQLFVLAVDTRSRLLGTANPVSGTINSLPVRAAEVFREAIVQSASGVIFVHNHPSGDPRPSAQDIHITRELLAAGRLLGIDLCDHVIVGAGKFLSMNREGYLKAR